MVNRPPSPTSPSAGSMTTDASKDDRIIVTTSHIVQYTEQSLGVSLNESALDDILLELDRSGYVTWVGVTRSGDYAWDLSESPERLGDAVAEAVVSRLSSWLQDS